MRYFLLLPLYFSQITFAGDLTIFDVRKPITLSEKDVVQKDFYIDSGSEVGIQKGMVVTVIRRVPLYDTYQSRSAGDLKVEVAKIKIIQVQPGLSVARFHASVLRADIPVLEDDFIMIGDKLDMSTATKDKRTAANDEAAETEEAAPAPAPAPTESEKKPEPLNKAVPPPAPAEVTSQKIEAQAPKDPEIKPIAGPTIQ